MRLLTGAVLVSVLAAGCSSGHSGSSASAARYADPNQLLTKVTAAGFQCDAQGDQPTYNAAGALSLACLHGPANETVYLDTFPSAAAKSADERLNTSAATSFVGANWGVFTQSAATLAALKRILAD